MPSQPPAPTNPPGGNRRDCPALGNVITSAECGSRRNSQIQCPASCPFNPFGIEAYDTWLALEHRWLPKSLDYAIRHVGRKRFQELMDEGFVEIPQAGPDDPTGTAHALLMGMNTVRDAQGRSGWERWEAEGWNGLNNDERYLAQCRRRTFASVFEVQRFEREHHVICLDVFEPGSAPFVIQDRGLAASAVRFDRFLTRATPYGHFVKPVDVAVPINFEIWEEWRRTMQEWFEEDRKGHPDLSFRSWLLEQFPAAMTAVTDVGNAWRKAMMEGMDFHRCVATYAITGDRAELESILESRIDFEPEEPPADLPGPKPLRFFRWLRRGESKEIEKDMPASFRHDDSGSEGWGVVGSVKLFSNRLVVETMSKRMFKFARELVGRFFGNRLRLEQEGVVDLAKQLAQEREVESVLEEAWTEPEPETEPEDAIDSMRGSVVHVVHFAPVHAGIDLEALLRRHPDFQEDELPADAATTGVRPSFTWNHAMDPDKPPGFIGGVVVRSGELRVLCFVEKSASLAAELLPEVLGGAVTFCRTEILDFRDKIRAQIEREFDFHKAMVRAREEGGTPPRPEDYGLDPDYDPSEFEALCEATQARMEAEETEEEAERPARKLSLADHPELAEQLHQSHYQRFLDDPVPMLDGHTPRAAAQDSALRPKLIELMKLHINGIARRNAQDGTALSLDWLLDQLGLAEMK